MDAVLIEEEALKLPPAQRALLADRLLSSLAETFPEIKQAWAQEARDRMSTSHEGTMEAVDGPEAMAKRRDRYSR